ncbi:MAG: DUF5606 domain-containing protein [Bacteroidales bacterium]|nr:DUF5606 domain-containing protein [Bacteroidales bacterium]
MDLTKILAITGKPGLYKMITQTKNGLVVESLVDGKKFTAFSHEKISTLEEISIYTEGEDKPLKEVFKAIYDMQEGKEAINHKSDAGELKDFFEKAIPDYDKENVYVSDIKKVINWYNILQTNDMIDFTEEEEEKKEERIEGKDTGENEDIPEATNKQEKD